MMCYYGLLICMTIFCLKILIFDFLKIVNSIIILKAFKIMLNGWFIHSLLISI